MNKSRPLPGSGLSGAATAASPGNNAPGKNAGLFEKLKHGDADAFGEVFARWERPLYFFLLKFTGSPQDAEDISQETFAKLWLGRDSIDLSQSVNFCIFRMAKQLAINYLRNMRRRGQVVSAGTYPDSADEHTVEHDFAAREIELIINLSIERLPPKVRKVYELHYKEGLSNDEIARRLGITANNVASQIYVARERLREVLPVLSLLFLIRFIRL